MCNLTKYKFTFFLFAFLVLNFNYAQNPKTSLSQTNDKTTTSNVEFLEGRIYIKINEITYHNPIKNGRRRVVQKQTSITTGFYGRISKSRVQLYQSKPIERLKCEPYTSCPVFNGSSKFVLQRDPNTMKVTESKEYPLQVTTKYLEQDYRWVKNQEKFVVTESTQASGINTLEGLNIEIKPYKPADNTTGATLAPLKPSYVLWITGGRDWSQADEPEQDGTNLKWDDFKEQLKPVNVPVLLEFLMKSILQKNPCMMETTSINNYCGMMLKDLTNFCLIPIKLTIFLPWEIVTIKTITPKQKSVSQSQFQWALSQN